MRVLDFLSRWDLALVPAVALLVSAVVYLWGVRRVAHRQPARSWPRWRTASFLSGLALLAFVVMGPIGAFDDELFWAHMVQHITIMMLAAPLLLIGAPVLLALRTSARQTRRRLLVPVLRSRPVRLLTNPVLTWVLFAGALIGTHFTPFYNYALTRPVVHDYVEHPLYLGVALLYFYPLVGANPVPHGPAPLAKVVSLVLMMAPEALTGFFIYTARSVLYPAYALSPRPFGLGALSDQQLGGGLMWCSGMVIGAGWIAVAVQAWLRDEARKGRRIDRQIAAELPRTGRPMSRAEHAVSTGPVNVPPGPDRRRVRRLNATALVTIPACLAAGAFELSRALGGNQLSWVYAAEWPVIAGYAIYMWRRLVREPTRGDDVTPSPPRGKERAEPGPVDMARLADPELTAWQDYLARLHAEHPPGGPSAGA